MMQSPSQSLDLSGLAGLIIAVEQAFHNDRFWWTFTTLRQGCK